MVMMNQSPEKQRKLYKKRRSKFSETTERRTTKPRPSFIKVLMKPRLRLSLLRKSRRIYGKLSNKNTKELTESRRFVFNLCEVNLSLYK